LPAIVLVTLHRPIARESQLVHVLGRASRMPVVLVRDGEKLHPRKCFVGLPSRHLTIGPGLVARLVPNGFYRGHNIDLLFGSLARHAGPRTVGVLLSGLLKDGTEGLSALKEAGGKALVQSPVEAAYKEMPRNAIEFDGPLDMIAPIHDLAQEICRLVHMTPAAPPSSAAVVQT
jgi:chemotaxis response regulator CheB